MSGLESKIKRPEAKREKWSRKQRMVMLKRNEKRREEGCKASIGTTGKGATVPSRVLLEMRAETASWP